VLPDPTDNGNNIDLNDLINTPGWKHAGARTTNDDGWILGAGVPRDDAALHAYLLIPEPSTLELLGLLCAPLPARRVWKVIEGSPNATHNRYHNSPRDALRVPNGGDAGAGGARKRQRPT